MSLCDRCIGPEKDFFIQSPTSLANDIQVVLGPTYRKSRLPEVTLIAAKCMTSGEFSKFFLANFMTFV